MILNERMTLLYCFVTALADGSEGAAFLVGRSGHSGCAGRRGSAAGARRAHHARTNTDLPSGRRPCMRRTLRLGGQRFAKPATASRPSRRSLERDASTRKRSSSRKAKVRPLSCRRICPSRGRRRLRRSSVRFHGGLFESPLTDSNRRPPSLPSSNEAERRARPGSRGHGSLARKGNRPKTSDLPWTPVPALVFPQDSLGYAGAGSPGRAISSVSAMVSLRPASVARMTSSAASEARARSMSSRPTGLSP